MKVEVAYAGPEGQAVEAVDLPAGATVADALLHCGLAVRLALDVAALACGIDGQRAGPHTPLHDGDRLELLRPLVADPKAARRARASEKPLPRARPAARRRRSPP